MKVLHEKGGKAYIAIAIDAAGDFVSPFADTLFPCMIWDHDGRFTEDQRAEVARQLLQAGCRYAVCGGQSCDAWHGAFDEEFVQQRMNDPDAALDDVHVMTTSHAGESPDDVAFFFVLNTNFGDHDFDRYLVLHVGDGQAMEAVDAAVRRYALGEDAA
ncbi:MAG: hypothetical protein Q8S73_13960 [Deltaproteobacteria bacterium]|nr:hypothetical protein [Myxococcales bacterium]MDP3215207.1 hypothetical protein [Deltaproteobacteria bacterium]